MSAEETTELRTLAESRLHTELEETHQELFNLRFQGATRQLADVSQVHKSRRRIARIKTLLRERQLLLDHDTAVAGSAASEPPADEPATDEPVADEAAIDEASEPAGDAPDEDGNDAPARVEDGE